MFAMNSFRWKRREIASWCFWRSSGKRSS
jgi:hypothetical protein